MKSSKNDLVKTIAKKPKKNIKSKTKKPAVEKIEDMKRLVQLLQIHQIELEHQNQELRITQQELEVSRNRYVNLFDFSPIPYFTLNQNGVIKEVNFSASKMFGIDRGKLIGKKIMAYVPQSEKDLFNSFIITVFENTGKHACELKMINKDKRVYQVRMEGLEFSDDLDSEKKCQLALIDLTEIKKVKN
ncbi:MAG: PAS domain-containing protein [Melioribacteraceae bacterium]